MATFRLDDDHWLLTTDNPGLPGRPVVLHRGRTYQPGELNGLPAYRVAAWAYVQLRVRPPGVTGAVELAEAYLRQWPEGPQLVPSELSGIEVPR